MIKNLQWTPEQIANITLPQLWALWVVRPQEVGGRAEQLALLNRKREEKGLPPLKPVPAQVKRRKMTPEEAKEAESRILEFIKAKKAKANEDRGAIR